MCLIYLGRFLVGCYWFCILIWISTYTANLAAFLTVQHARQPIGNLEDLADSSYQVVVINSTSIYEKFKTSTHGTHKQIWHKIQSAGTIASSHSQGIQWVREKKDFAFIFDGQAARYVANQPPCDLTTGRQRAQTYFESISETIIIL